MTIEIVDMCDSFDDIRSKAIRIIDLETTGLNPDDDVVEAGVVDLDITTGEICDVASQIVRPCKSIPAEACAIHHITDDDVASAPSWPDVWPRIFNDDQNVIAFAAHQAKFDGQWINADLLRAKPLICTYKSALRVWPDAPGHSNQVLRYWLNLPVDRDRAIPTHRALPDAYVTAHLLRELLKTASFDDLVLWSQEPALLTKVRFGKYRGMKWTDVPSDYIDWIVFKSGFDDEDVMHTARMLRANRLKVA
jgi:exodeoxyribonuclease X